MFKKMKLATKLYSGFGVMVAIAAVLGYMGWSSLGKIEHVVLIGDEANEFIKIIEEARLAKKDFIRYGDEKYAQEMLGQKEAFNMLVEEITARMTVAADKQLVAGMHTEAGTYIDQAQQYVDLAGQITALTAESGPIVQSARNTQALVAEMSQDQEMKLAAIMDVQAKVAGGSRAHLQWAGAVKDFLADKDAILNVQTDGHKCAFGQWLDSSEYAEQAAFCGQEFRDLIEEARQKHLELHNSAIEIAAARSGDTDTSLQVYQEKAAPLLEFILGEFERAEDLLNDTAAQGLANANDAKRIIELLLAARQQEKNYFLRNTDEYVKKANDQADSAFALAEDLKSRFQQQVNKDQVQQAIDACLTYKKAFADVVDYKGQQKICEEMMVAAARKLTEQANNLRTAKKTEMEAVAARSNTIMITLAIAGVVLGTILALVITRGITKPINRIITGLNEGADQVNDAAAQVSSASQQLAAGASEQASSLEETSSALEEMAAMTRTNAENAKEANNLSGQARDAAQSGDQTMAKLNNAMTAINESSGQISKIIKVIEEIAFQTNLLALNAAVEAARAGEHGKGFAVVADEVRNLAQRCAQAAGETTSLIEDSIVKAKEGTDVAGDVGKALGAIVGDVTKVTNLINGISQASDEQAQGVDQINTAVSQMDKVTQQNAAGAEESASAAEELSAQAQTVKGMVDELSALVGGRGGNSRATYTTTSMHKTNKQHRVSVAHLNKGFHRVSAGGNHGAAAKETGNSLDDEFMTFDEKCDQSLNEF
ncbi:MAG: methyl-accepting chemotaxis protein [Planctomycetota bacterium]